MYKGRVSVIVPIYNGEKYLDECIMSILGSTYPDIELLLVNDGSDDNSGNICAEYAQKDSRIIVLEQENKGVSSARNLGLENATGEFVSFVDCDDRIHPDAYEFLVEKMREHVDFIQFGYRRLNEKGEILQLFKAHDAIWTGELLSYYLFPRFPAGIWSKMYRRSCLFDEKGNQIVRFNEDIRVWEDWLFNCRYLNKCKSYGLVCEKVLYDYRIHSESVSREAFSEKQMDIIKAYEELLHICGTDRSVCENLQLAYCEILVKTLRKAYKERENNRESIKRLKREIRQLERGYLQSEKAKGKMKICILGMHFFPQITTTVIDKIV